MDHTDNTEHAVEQKLAEEGGVTNLIITNQTEVDKWWASQDAKVVNVIGASVGVAEEGGMTPEISSPLQAIHAANAGMRSPHFAAHFAAGSARPPG